MIKDILTKMLNYVALHHNNGGYCKECETDMIYYDPERVFPRCGSMITIR